jgi:hypothetical protein
VNLPDFYDALERHDWHYAMSDDNRVYTAGRKRQAELIEASQLSEAHNSLYEQYSDHVYSGPAYGTEQAPKPERPQA